MFTFFTLFLCLSPLTSTGFNQYHNPQFSDKGPTPQTSAHVFQAFFVSVDKPNSMIALTTYHPNIDRLSTLCDRLWTELGLTINKDRLSVDHYVSRLATECRGLIDRRNG